MTTIKPKPFVPAPTFPGKPTTSASPAYRAELKTMSDSALKAEIEKQKMRIYVGTHGIRADPEMVADASAKLVACRAEELRRAVKPSAELVKYAAEVKKMDKPELQAEIKRQEMRLYIAIHGFVPHPEMVKDAEARLKICKAALGAMSTGK